MIARDKMIRARTKLILSQPFFGALAMGLALEEAPGLGSMATDGKLVLYDPTFVDELTEPECAFVLAHETLHVANLHHTRQGAREHDMWNEACDYAINPILVRAGFTMPKSGLINPAYDAMPAEKIYELLRQAKGNGGGGGKQPGGSAGQGAPLTGDGSGGKPHKPISDPGGTGAVMRTKGKNGGKPTRAEVQQAEVNASMSVVQAAALAKARGQGSADIDRMAAQFVEPKLPWQTLLRDFVDRNANADYSWRRPNPRYAAMDIYLPMLDSKEAGHFVIAVDTSGSVGGPELAEFRAEIASIFDTIKPTRCDVIYCDDQVKRVDAFETGDEFTMKAEGGGGTSFIPPFDYVAEQGDQPQCLIYLTDMHGSFPQVDPGYPVLWISTSAIDKAPFGEVIALK